MTKRGSRAAEVVRFPVGDAEFPPAPTHLSERMVTWWGQVVREYALQPHHLELLRRAAESWDLAEEARKILAVEGPVVKDRFGQDRAHPAAAIWKDNTAQFQRLVREIGFDAAPEDSRPPRLY